MAKKLDRTVSLVSAVVNGIETSDQARDMFIMARTWLIANDPKTLEKIAAGTTALLKTQGHAREDAAQEQNRYAELEKRISNLEYLMVHAQRPAPGTRQGLVSDPDKLVAHPWPPFAVTNGDGRRFTTGQFSITPEGKLSSGLDLNNIDNIGTFKMDGALNSNAPSKEEPTVQAGEVEVPKEAKIELGKAPADGKVSDSQSTESLLNQILEMIPVVESVIKETGGNKGVYTLSTMISAARDAMGDIANGVKSGPVTMGDLLTSIDRVQRLRSRLGSNFVTGNFKSPEDLVGAVRSFISKAAKDDKK